MAIISRIKTPRLYALNVERHRLIRWFFWLFGRQNFARPLSRVVSLTSNRIFRHRSVLLRKLNNVDMRLQHNKVINLRLAAQCINETVILPGQTFSFWRLVGRPTARRGFVTGLLLSQGEVLEGVGGGLCQMANLLFWLFLHTPLTVTERHHHSFDAFPDSGRVLPFGSGATIFYNYVDLQARNDTRLTFRIRLWVDDRFLRGEVMCGGKPTYSYKIIERNHRFVYDHLVEKWFRENDLFRCVRDRQTGQLIAEEHLLHNYSQVMYDYHPAGVN